VKVAKQKEAWEWVPAAPAPPKHDAPAAAARAPFMAPSFSHRWFWKSRLPERRGQPCRVMVRGKRNSILVAFEDGFNVVTSRWAVRRISP
jgi:hypothetical protein